MHIVYSHGLEDLERLNSKKFPLGVERDGVGGLLLITPLQRSLNCYYKHILLWI